MPVSLEQFATLTKLEYLNLSNCAGFTGSLEPLRFLVALVQLYLGGCVGLEGELEPLSALQALRVLDVEACVGLVGTLDALFGLRSLEKLNVCDTNLIGTADFSSQHLGGRGRCKVGRIDMLEQTPLLR